MSRRSLPKAQGDAAESLFLHRAISLGLTVSKPWGDNSKYDFIVDNGRRLIRVQVRSVSLPQDDAFRVSTGCGNRSKIPYTPADIDLLAAYVEPHHAWYLIPVETFAPVTSIWLFPHRTSSRSHRFERFREAWDLLKE
ncbi:MAG TPA: group I intron-associated PD-(D/E)XK endonuclease [Terriglobales bacterium]|nr:group I intron-associated PD-(D/E)XK endonuclease [Terriglobales bacterium]